VEFYRLAANNNGGGGAQVLNAVLHLTKITQEQGLKIVDAINATNGSVQDVNTHMGKIFDVISP
jgi:hypothetical protein